MKSLNQFKGKTSVLEEESNYAKFDILVRAGLADKSQIKRLHRVLDKMSEDRPVLNPTEKTIVQNLLSRMVDLITNNQQIFQKTRQAVREDLNEGVVVAADKSYNPYTGRKYPAHRKVMGSKSKDGDNPPAPIVQESLGNIPFILVLKRKAIRMYPDGTKVALYYNEKLNKYFSVPYTDSKTLDAVIQSEGVEEVKATVFDSLNYIIETNKSNYVLFDDGSSKLVDIDTATAIVETYNSLEEENQQKLIENVSKDKSTFKTISEFAWKHYK
jgi:hypothetical protein